MKTVSLTTTQVILLNSQVLDKITEFPSLKVSYKMSKLSGELALITKAFDDKKVKLFSKYGKKAKDENGNEILSLDDLSKGDRKKFDEEYNKLLVESFDISEELLYGIRKELLESEYSPEDKESNKAYHLFFRLCEEIQMNEKENNKP